MGNDNAWLTIWIISTFLAWILTAAFWDQTVSTQDINKAIEVCEVNGGLEELQSDATAKLTVTCKNGAVFNVKAD